MAIRFRDVTLSPDRDGDEVTFDGTNANERITLANPRGFDFSADLALGGGRDAIPQGASTSATIDAGAGDDSVNYEAELIELDGGAGNDVFGISAVEAVLRGGSGSDNFDIGAADLFVDGGSGNDSIDASNSFERDEQSITVRGGAGSDELNATGVAVQADGGADNDVIFGISRESGARIAGGLGDDRIERFIFEQTGGVNRLDGGDGDDSVNFNLGFESAGRVDAVGGAGNDTVSYTVRSDEDPGDSLVRFFGGPGTDELVGGAAADEFRFVPANSRAGAGRDAVVGFDPGTDLLVVEGDADRTRSGAQEYLFVGEGAPGGGVFAGSVGYFESGGDTIVRGSDGRTTFEFRLDGFQDGLTAADFGLDIA